MTVVVGTNFPEQASSTTYLFEVEKISIRLPAYISAYQTCIIKSCYLPFVHAVSVITVNKSN